jgi:hypothetical protein
VGTAVDVDLTVAATLGFVIGVCLAGNVALADGGGGIGVGVEKDLSCGGVRLSVAIGICVAVAVALGVGRGVTIGVNVGNGLGVENGVCVGVAVGIATIASAEVRTAGVDLVLGDAVGVNLGFGIGVEGAAVALGVDRGDGVGVVEGDADSIGSLSDSDGDSFFVAAFAVVAARTDVVPGSDQPLVISPLANVACNRVCPCSLITRPSNFPWTIFPV